MASRQRGGAKTSVSKVMNRRISFIGSKATRLPGAWLPAIIFAKTKVCDNDIIATHAAWQQL